MNCPGRIAIAMMIGLAAGCRRADDRAPTSSPEDRGRAAIQRYGCGSCHTIPGIPGADALVGPPLGRIGSRSYVAGVLVNTHENLIRWVLNPPGVDPMTAMPNLDLTETDARDVARYLESLR